MSSDQVLVLVSLNPDVTCSSEVGINPKFDHRLERLDSNVESAQAQVFARFYEK